ncbi:MAG: PTS fructose transporter subunit IIA [Methylophilaceae bacterium]|nr:PTS fructose transporter subunit IIA [Methylophilaceae bacterium]
MIGILIIAHGSLGDSLVHCASHVMGGRPPLLLQMGVAVQDDPAVLLPKAATLVQKLKEQGCGGVLVLSDIYGATPCNIASRLLEAGKVEGIAGVNLPMLVRALAYRNLPLERLVEKVIEGGTAGIVHITKEVGIQ